MGTWRQRTLLRSEGVVCPGPPRCQLLHDTDLSPFSRSSPLKVSSTQKDNIVYSSHQPLPDRTLLRGPSRLNPRIEGSGYFIGLGSPKEQLWLQLVQPLPCLLLPCISSGTAVPATVWTFYGLHEQGNRASEESKTAGLGTTQPAAP